MSFDCHGVWIQFDYDFGELGFVGRFEIESLAAGVTFKSPQTRFAVPFEESSSNSSSCFSFDAGIACFFFFFFFMLCVLLGVCLGTNLIPAVVYDSFKDQGLTTQSFVFPIIMSRGIMSRGSQCMHP
ncbi:hypothetical protein Droror1_Dr00027291 [Drosera rotundifolia]